MHANVLRSARRPGFARLTIATAALALALLAETPGVGAESAEGAAVAPGAPDSSGPAVLTLSADQAVARALDQSADLEAARLGPRQAAESSRAARGAYDPVLHAGVTRTSNQTPPTTALEGPEGSREEIWDGSTGVGVHVGTGADVDLSFSTTRRNSTSDLYLVNPSYDAGATLTLRQPLLRDRGLDAARHGVRAARTQEEVAAARYRDLERRIAATVRERYLDVVYAGDFLDVERRSRDLARTLMKETESRVRAETAAPLDLVAARSELASREEEVIAAENALADAEDALRRLLFRRYEPGAWETRLVLTDRPNAAADTAAVDSAAAEEAVKRALEERADLAIARGRVSLAALDANFGGNQGLPRLDVLGSYGRSGLGGDRLIRTVPFGPVTGTTQGTYGDALDDVTSGRFPSWSLGLQLSAPIGNRAGRGKAARARLAREEAEADLRRLELDAAREVRAAARAVTAASRRVTAAHAARELQSERARAEERKLAAGLSTNFLVTQAQRDLRGAEATELRAVTDYERSRIRLARAIEAGAN